MSDDLIRGALPYVPEGVPLDLKEVVDNLSDTFASMMQSAFEPYGWPDEGLRRMMLAIAVGAIVDEEGINAAIAAVTDELEALKKTTA